MRRDEEDKEDGEGEIFEDGNREEDKSENEKDNQGEEEGQDGEYDEYFEDDNEEGFLTADHVTLINSNTYITFV
jgi:hypothetical protein